MPSPPVASVVPPVVPSMPSIPLVPPVHSDAQGPVVDMTEPVEHEQHSLARVGDSGTNISVNIPQSHAVEVIATRPGFIYNTRKSAGDRFKVSDESQVGDWMILADSTKETARQAQIKLAKLKARS